MGSKTINNGIPDTELNAPLRYTVGSAAEAEIGGVYDAGQTAVALRQALQARPTTKNTYQNRLCHSRRHTNGHNAAKDVKIN